MAEVVDSFPAHRNTKYDWKKWFDGRCWKLTPETDFPGVTAHNFRKMAIYAASRKAIRLQTSIDRKSAVYVMAVGKKRS